MDDPNDPPQQLPDMSENGFEWMNNIQVQDLNWLNDIHAIEVDGDEFQEVFDLLDNLDDPPVNQMVGISVS